MQVTPRCANSRGRGRTGLEFDVDNVTCKLDGCDRPRSKRSVWCGAHLHRVQRNGTPGSPEVAPYRRIGCKVDSCNGRHFGHGFCQVHHYRWAKHGDPLTVSRVGQSAGPTHSAWKGDAISYGGAHRRVMRHRGKASANQCSTCDDTAQEWAYTHSATHELIDPATGFPYSGDVNDYQPMCFPCHRRYDANPDEWLACVGR